MTDLPSRADFVAVANVTQWSAYTAAHGAVYDFVQQGWLNAPPQARTIASGVITPQLGAVDVTPESGSADTLTQMQTTTIADGRAVMVRTTSGNTITLEHGAGGTGQLLIGGAVNKVLSNTEDWILFQRQGTNWMEIARNVRFMIGDTIQAFDANTALTDTAQAFTAPQRAQRSASTITASETLDFGTAQNWDFTVDTSSTLAQPTVPAGAVGQTGTINFTRGSTGGALAWHADFVAPTGLALPTAFSVATAGAKITVPYRIFVSGKVHCFAHTTWDS